MLELTIQSMTCGHCTSTVTQAVKSVDPEAEVNVDLATKKLRVETTAGREAVVGALTDAGYPPN